MAIKKVVIVGFGYLASQIANQLLKDGFEVTLFTSNAEEMKNKWSELTKLGLRIQQLDLNNVDNLSTHLKGQDALVSAVGGEQSLLLDLQLRLLEASKNAGLRLFIPSEYGIDYSKVPKNHLLEAKRIIAEKAASSGIPCALPTIGILYQFGFSSRFRFDLTSGKVYLTGNGNIPINLTHVGDVAKIVSCILKENKTGKIYASSTRLTENQIIDLYEKETGKKIERIPRSLEEWKNDQKNAKNGNAGFVPWIRSISLEYGAQDWKPQLDFGKPISLQDFWRENPK